MLCSESCGCQNPGGDFINVPRPALSTEKGGVGLEVWCRSTDATPPNFVLLLESDVSLEKRPDETDVNAM